MRLISVERMCTGREFQTVGAATGKFRRPSSVLVRGTSMSRRSAERRCARTRDVRSRRADVLEVCWASATDDYVSLGAIPLIPV